MGRTVSRPVPCRGWEVSRPWSTDRLESGVFPTDGPRTSSVPRGPSATSRPHSRLQTRPAPQSAVLAPVAVHAAGSRHARQLPDRPQRRPAPRQSSSSAHESPRPRARRSMRRKPLAQSSSRSHVAGHGAADRARTLQPVGAVVLHLARRTAPAVTPTHFCDAAQRRPSLHSTLSRQTAPRSGACGSGSPPQIRPEAQSPSCRRRRPAVPGPSTERPRSAGVRRTWPARHARLATACGGSVVVPSGGVRRLGLRRGAEQAVAAVAVRAHSSPVAPGSEQAWPGRPRNLHCVRAALVAATADHQAPAASALGPTGQGPVVAALAEARRRTRQRSRCAFATLIRRHAATSPARARPFAAPPSALRRTPRSPAGRV